LVRANNHARVTACDSSSTKLGFRNTGLIFAFEHFVGGTFSEFRIVASDGTSLIGAKGESGRTSGLRRTLLGALSTCSVCTLHGEIRIAATSLLKRRTKNCRLYTFLI